MNKFRTWMAGLGVSAPCLISLFLLSPSLGLTSSGPVHGRVTYNGHPLHGGQVFFEPVEGEATEWVVGSINPDGSYSCNPKWERGYWGQSRFRICVLPGPGGIESRMPSPSEAEDEGITMSHACEVPDPLPPEPVVDRFPNRFTKTATSGLSVMLGRDPAYVNIDLKD